MTSYSPKSKDIQFTIIYNSVKQQILLSQGEICFHSLYIFHTETCRYTVHNTSNIHLVTNTITYKFKPLPVYPQLYMYMHTYRYVDIFTNSVNEAVCSGLLRQKGQSLCQSELFTILKSCVYNFTIRKHCVQCWSVCFCWRRLT